MVEKDQKKHPPKQHRYEHPVVPAGPLFDECETCDHDREKCRCGWKNMSWKVPTTKTPILGVDPYLRSGGIDKKD